MAGPHPQTPLGALGLGDLNDPAVEVLGAAPQQRGHHNRAQRQPRVDKEHRLEAVRAVAGQAGLVVPLHCLRVQRPRQICRLHVAACGQSISRQFMTEQRKLFSCSDSGTSL